MFWKKKKSRKDNEMVTVASNGSQQLVRLKVVIKTDLGNVRTNNEDAAASFNIVDEKGANEKGFLLVVADGMGGHLAGEVASNLAVETVREAYFKSGDGDNKENILQQAFKRANKRIFELATEKAQYRGMGTTCTVLAVVGQEVYYAHAGDSRAYFHRNNSLTRITEDHTYVQELVNKGVISELESASHPERNILTNAMGTKPDLKVDTGKCKFLIERGDRLMLCSDGLTGYLDDNELASILSNNSLQDCAEYCIMEAKRRGGMDNITIVVAEAGEKLTTDESKTTREIDVVKLTRDADLPLI